MRRNRCCRILFLLLVVLSSITFFIEVINQMLHVSEEDEHLATCFGPTDATFTMVTIGENFDPSLREDLLKNKRSWAKKAQRANVLVLHENRSVTRHGVE